MQPFSFVVLDDSHIRSETEAKHIANNPPATSALHFTSIFKKSTQTLNGVFQGGLIN